MPRRFSGIFEKEKSQEELASNDVRPPKTVVTSQTKSMLSKIRKKKKNRSSVESSSPEEAGKSPTAEEGPLLPDDEEEILDAVPSTVSCKATKSGGTNMRNPVVTTSTASQGISLSASNPLSTNPTSPTDTVSTVATTQSSVTSKATSLSAPAATTPVPAKAKTTSAPAATKTTPVPVTIKTTTAPTSDSRRQYQQDKLYANRRWQSDRSHDRTPRNLYRDTGGGAFGAPKAAYKDKEDEIRNLLEDIRRIGGGLCVTFGHLFDDDQVQNRYEALVGTLKGARKRGYIAFEGQMLLKGIHDKVIIQILKDVDGVAVDAGNDCKTKEAPPQDVGDRTTSRTKISPLPSVAEGGGNSTAVNLPGSTTAPPVTPPRTDSDMAFAPSPAMTKTPSPFRPFNPSTPPTPSSPASEFAPPARASTSYTRSTTTTAPKSFTGAGNENLPNPSTRYTAGSTVGRRKWTPPKRSSSMPAPWGVPATSSWTPPIVSSSTVLRASQRRGQATVAPTVSPYRKTRAKSMAHTSLATKEVQQGIDDEIHELLNDIRRVGEAGEPNVTFGQLFDDDIVQNRYEALVGTLKGARKRGYIHFAGQILLKGMHDGVTISIVDRDEKATGGSHPTVSGQSITAW